MTKRALRLLGETPQWLGFGILLALARLPLAWQLWLGRGLGSLAGKLARRRRHIAEVNLGLCFPDLDRRRRRQLVDTHFRSLGMALFETTAAWWFSDERLSRHIEFQGLEHLQRAYADGRGVILLTGHFTMLELGARVLLWQGAFYGVYRPHKNSAQHYFMQRARERHAGRSHLARDDVRGVIKALRGGEAVWYAPDQNLGRKRSALVPFFGVPALTITATSRLAQSGNAIVVPYFPRRLANGRYRIEIEPALTEFPGGDEHTDAARVNDIIERWVRQAPEQYLWVHRRFRRRDKAASNVYE